MHPLTRNERMHAQIQPLFLLASSDPVFLSAVEPVLVSLGGRINTVLSTEAALTAMTASCLPAMALIDVRLQGMEMAQLLAAARADEVERCFPIVLFSDTVSDEWKDRLEEGVVSDLLPLHNEAEFLRLRLELVLHSDERRRELEMLRESVAMNVQTDLLTGTLNRATLLAMLFRETDRVQRMNTSLCMILFDIDDFSHWNERLGARACDALLVQVTARVMRLLRSYDLLGRVGTDEFVAALPGCSTVNAVLLAERICQEVFGEPFEMEGNAVRLTACFGVASSNGRSPVVVLREAEHALLAARESGSESIRRAVDGPVHA